MVSLNEMVNPFVPLLSPKSRSMPSFSWCLIQVPSPWSRSTSIIQRLGTNHTIIASIHFWSTSVRGLKFNSVKKSSCSADVTWMICCTNVITASHCCNNICTAKGYKILEESISAYKDDAGRYSEACPAHVALRAACICRGKVAQRNHWDYFILPRCTTLVSLQKTSLFLPQRRCKSRTETSDITHATSYRKPSQRPSLRLHVVGVTSRRSRIIM